ncbi:MAG: fatty acid desaturase [Thermodesulfobacteriota bacterium]
MLNWSALLTVIVAAHVLSHWAAYAAAIVLIGTLQNRLIAMSHECWHGKAFRHRTLNQLVGAWLYAYPIATPYFSDQKRHMQHHRLLGRPEDPDWIDYERPAFHSAAGIVKFLAGQLLGAKLVLRVLDVLRPGRTADEARETQRRVKPARGDLAGMAVMQVLVLGAFALAGRWWEYVLLWFVPLVTVTSFLVTFRALLEHVHPDRDVEPARRYYDFSPGPVQRWFVSPVLFHLHALHHTYPGVPYYRLPTLRRTILEHGFELPGEVKQGYVSALLGHLRELDRRALVKAA